MAKTAVITLPYNLNVAKVLLEQAHQSQLPIVFIDEKAKVEAIPQEWWPENVSGVICDMSDIDGIQAIIEELKCENVISTAEKGLHSAAVLRERLGIAGHSLEVELNSLDKCQMRSVLVNAGLSDVQHTGCTVGELSALLSSVKFPVVAKPAQGTGSICVQFLENVQEANEYIERVLSHPLGNEELALTLESYISGKEYSIEGLLLNGKAYYYGVTEKRTTEAPYFVECGHTFFNEHALMAEQFTSYFDEVFAALGMTTCPFHLEVKVDGDKVEVIEAHSRFGGDFITDLIEYSTGNKIYRDYFSYIKSGSLPDLKEQEIQLASIEFLLAESGKLRAIPDSTQLKAKSEVLIEEVDFPAGSDIVASMGYYERVGRFVYKNQNVEEQLAALQDFQHIAFVD